MGQDSQISCGECHNRFCWGCSFQSYSHALPLLHSTIGSGPKNANVSDESLDKNNRNVPIWDEICLKDVPIWDTFRWRRTTLMT